jgi:putative DNA methylase
VVRRFAQPLGIDLSRWEGRIIETEKGVVRLLAVRERTKQLFGGKEAAAVALRVAEMQEPNRPLVLFPELEPAATGKRRRPGAGPQEAADAGDLGVQKRHEATTLDRVHMAMLLQASGQSNALRALLEAERERGPDFLRLANALSALYPKGSEEKRLLDAVLLAMPR